MPNIKELIMIKKQLLRVLSKFRDTMPKDGIAIFESGIKLFNETINRYTLTQMSGVYNDTGRLIEYFKALKNNNHEGLGETIKEITSKNIGYGAKSRVMRMNHKPSRRSPKKEMSPVVEKEIDVGFEPELQKIYYSGVLTEYFGVLNKTFEIPPRDIVDMIFNCLMNKLDARNIGEYNLLKFCYRLKLYLSRMNMQGIKDSGIVEKYDALNMYNESVRGMLERKGYILTRTHLSDPVDMSLMNYLGEMVAQC